ncbi:MAG: hypothetical protein ACWA42_06800 [Lutibacter sp.]
MAEQINKKRFNDYVSKKALEGFIIVDKDADALIAVLEGKRKVKHILHAILTMLTCGVWGIIWAIIAYKGRNPYRIRVSFDDTGNLIEEKI